MLGTTLTTGSGVLGGMQEKVTSVVVRSVANGFIIEGYCVELKIAKTIDEALALVRKEFEL